MFKLFVLILFAGVFHFAQAQPEIPIGTWRTHLNYTRAITVAAAGDRIYCATRNSLFYFDKEDGSLNKLSKTDGLSDLNVSALAYDSQSGSLLIGYENGNIDLIRKNKIINFNAIKNEELNSLKTINHMTFRDNLVYISTDFGMPVLDIDKVEMRETYFPGMNGTFLKINSSAIVGDSIFIATEKGVKAGSLNENVNLIDFRNWKTFDASEGLSPHESFHSVVEVGGLLYAATADSLFIYREGLWTGSGLDEPIRSVNKSGDTLLICLETRVILIHSESEVAEMTDLLISDPQQAALDEGILWIADQKNGLVTNIDGGFKSIHPSGPAANLIGQMLNAGDSLIAIPYYPPDIDSAERKAAFFVFKNGEWVNYNRERQDIDFPEDRNEFTDLAVNEGTGAIFFVSPGTGVVAWRGGGSFERIENFEDKQIISAAVDHENTLWLTDYGQNPSLYSLNSENNAQSYFINQTGARYIVEILPYNNGDKWLRVNPKEGGGVIVYNEETNQSRRLTDASGEGGLPSRNVNKLAVDRDGYIWAATDQGVVYFANPFSALRGVEFDAIYPIYEQRRLLVGETLTSLAVDPGNRKWIGATNGLWLFSDAGEALFHHFTAENSPLLSSRILDIEIMKRTGEVFIATDRGLISFRSDATRAEPGHKAVQIFPNPVPPDFNGEVGISGLAEDAHVKITDISGKLISEVRAFGGTATWNVLNYRGERASAGIYLVFSASSNGEDTYVGKIAVIN